MIIFLLDRYNIKVITQRMSSDEENGEAVYSDSDSDVPNRESYMSGRDTYSVSSVNEQIIDKKGDVDKKKDD